MTISYDYSVDSEHAMRESRHVIEIEERDEAGWQAVIGYVESRGTDGSHEPAQPRRAARANHKRSFKAMHEAAELAAVEAQAERDGWLAGMGWL